MDVLHSGSSASDVFSTAILADPSGNIYLGGYFDGTQATFGAIQLANPGTLESFYVARVGGQLTGLNEQTELNAVSIFPNPSRGGIQIDSGADPIQTIRVYNSLGKELVVKKCSASLVTLSLENLPVGVYMVHIKTINKGLFVRKVVKAD